MNRREYFLKALRAGAGKKRVWVNSVFTVVQGVAPGFTVEDYPYRLVQTEEGLFFNDPSTGGLTLIDDPIPDEPLFEFQEELFLQPGDIENYAGPGELHTTYGNAYVNQMLLVIPFGPTIPFIAGYVDVEVIEGEVVKRLIDDPENDDGVSLAPDGKIYCRQYLTFCDYALATVGYAPQAVVSVTPKSMQGHPDRRKLRDALVKEFEGKLDDPAVVAKIGDALEKLDYDWLRDDPSFQFYMSDPGKLMSGVRKKLFSMVGGESPFSDGTTVEFIAKSLEEGIDTDHMVALNNSLRYGSYNRGSQTKLGGESTKTIYRMLGTARITEVDCQTRVGIPTKITAFNKKRMVGYYILEQGQSLLLTAENVNTYVGKVVDMRSPLSCKAGREPDTGEPGKGKNVCAHCMGVALAEQPNGLSAAAAGLGGRFLTLFLKKMHAGSLKTTKWDFKERIS